MRVGTIANSTKTKNIFPATLFILQFLYLWVSVDPYVEVNANGSENTSSLINQFSVLLLFTGVIYYIRISPLKGLILQPRVLMVLLILWMVLAAWFSNERTDSFKQVILSLILLINASVFLLLPRSEEQFAKMVMAGLLIMLGFAYFGVLFKPLQAIHQFSTELGDEQQGNWRGHFAHKNVAAAAMLISSCYGLYLKDKGFRLAGWLILFFSAIFLTHTGGKTSTAMLPLILLIAFVFERIRWLRWPIVVGGVLLINFLTVGAALIPAVYDFLESLGIDASFTNRADIWRFAVNAIADKPFLGHGLHGYWQTERLINNDTVENWSPRAFNGHNAWVDALINLGVVGFVLIVIWVIFLPLIYIRRITKRNLYSPLVRLYVRIWLFAVFSSAMESAFFETGSLLWFSCMMAIFGMRLQAFALPQSGKSAMVSVENEPTDLSKDSIGVKQ
ncbi:O-antigen ligase family protein [Pseudochrobactrum kiredjianiae]|uniref:O-antigen ligase family protein n=1 Tax=Pseudochrobactrum kiredjianiae TaxID=386305 RepID=A0ABW3V856_9HYPH|nr:O-antigen ligase [Pseudochrobactrum kiredjianiae]MDM7850196.1 O-antigen ligase [Pseudochrobactrum kiredjianiae]